MGHIQDGILEYPSYMPGVLHFTVLLLNYYKNKNGIDFSHNISRACHANEVWEARYQWEREGNVVLFFPVGVRLAAAVAVAAPTTGPWGRPPTLLRVRLWLLPLRVVVVIIIVIVVVIIGVNVTCLQFLLLFLNLGWKSNTFSQIKLHRIPRLKQHETLDLVTIDYTIFYHTN